MSFIGMDVAEVTAFARELADTADDLNDIRVRLAARVGTGAWVGPDADGAFSTLEDVLAALYVTVSAVTDLHGEVRRAIEVQRETSESY